MDHFPQERLNQKRYAYREFTFFNGRLPLLVEVARETYKSRLGSKGATRSADPQHLEYILPGDRLLTVDLHYVNCDSPTGFPYHRLTCKMQLDGQRITKAQLHDLCTTD